MATKPRIGAGNVTIELDGETVELRPSLKAAQTISRQNGGVRNAMQSVGALDFDTVVNVVGLGIGAEGRQLKDLPEKVYRTGLADLIVPVTRYLSVIANGGRSASGEDDGGSGDADPRE